MQITFSGFIPLIAGAALIASLEPSYSAALASVERGPPVVYVRAIVSSRPPRKAVPKSYLGFSVEYGSVPRMFGRPVVMQAIARLTNRLGGFNGAPVFRIGGNSQDRAVWHLQSSAARTSGNAIVLKSALAADLLRLVNATGTRLILGLNLGRASAGQAIPWIRASQRIIGFSHIMAFEIGNEPDLYDRHGARPRSYSFTEYQAEFRTFAGIIRPFLLRKPMLAGPAFTGPWRRFTPAFIARESNSLAVVTMHQYPLGAPVRNHSSPKFASLANLLKPSSVSSFVSLISTSIRAGHARHIPVRFSEINSAYMGGKRGVSNAFAQSLWSLDLLFTLASIHCDGVNFHTGPVYGAFWPDRNGVRVLPLYYGMWMFAQAVAGHAGLVPVRYRTKMNLKIWATRDSRGTLRVVVINKDLRRTASIQLAVPPALAGRPAARVERLTAPSAGARTHITLGGRTFGKTVNGLPTGRPLFTRIIGHKHTFTIIVPPASALMLSDMSAASGKGK